MTSQRATLYRGLLRELRKSITPPRKVNTGIIARFRTIAETIDDKNAVAKQEIENATLFIKSQREHKRLLERYNPTFDLTSQERVRATTRRVGLDMPITYKPE